MATSLLTGSETYTVAAPAFAWKIACGSFDETSGIEPPSCDVHAANAISATTRAPRSAKLLLIGSLRRGRSGKLSRVVRNCNLHEGARLLGKIKTTHRRGSTRVRAAERGETVPVFDEFQQAAELIKGVVYVADLGKRRDA